MPKLALWRTKSCRSYLLPLNWFWSPLDNVFHNQLCFIIYFNFTFWVLMYSDLQWQIKWPQNILITCPNHKNDVNSNLNRDATPKQGFCNITLNIKPPLRLFFFSFLLFFVCRGHAGKGTGPVSDEPTFLMWNRILN